MGNLHCTRVSLPVSWISFELQPSHLEVTETSRLSFTEGIAVILSERIRQSAATGASFLLSLQGHTILLVIQLRVGELFVAQGNLIFKARRGIPSQSVVSLLDYVLG